MLQRFLPVLLSIWLSAHAAAAATIEGITFPDTYPIDGRALLLNGLGLRTLTIFNIKAYVAALYVQQQSHSAQQILNAPGPKVILMEFLHAGTKADIERQYRKGEQENCGNGECDPSDAADFERLIAAAPGVEPGDTYTYVLTDRGVQLYANKKLMVDLANKDLALRILAGFIGEHPPSASLKQQLLGQRE
jgi:hypothetical protein